MDILKSHKGEIVSVNAKFREIDIVRTGCNMEFESGVFPVSPKIGDKIDLSALLGDAEMEAYMENETDEVEFVHGKWHLFIQERPIPQHVPEDRIYD